MQYYFFTIKKCRKDTCTICKKPQFSQEVFTQLHCLSDPVPDNSIHYKPFEELYSTIISEKYRPLHQETPQTESGQRKRKEKGKTKYTMPFCPSAFHAKNIGVTITCVECDKPWLLFSAKKLSDKDY